MVNSRLLRSVSSIYIFLSLLSLARFECRDDGYTMSQHHNTYATSSASSAHRLLRKKRKAPADVVRTGATDGGLEMIKSRETHAYSDKPALQYYTPEEQAAIEEMTKAYHTADIMSMYRPVLEVSVEKPFIFFHQRKAGGSTLRHEFYKAAEALNLPRYIACYGNILCDNYRIPLNSPKAIYAMHIQWGEQKVLDQLRFHSSNTDDGVQPTEVKHQRSRHRRGRRNSTNSHINAVQPRQLLSTMKNVSDSDTTASESSTGLLFKKNKVDFSCMTNFREPVSRLISCVYFRFLNLSNYYRYVKKACIGDLSREELIRLLMERVDKYGNSCLNEPYRILSGVIDEDMLNNLGMNYDKVAANITNRINTFSAEVYNATLMRVAKCPPMILEYPESAQLIAHKFPIFFTHGAFRQKKALMSQNYNSKCAPPSAEQMAIFEQLGAFERLIYDTVLQKTKEAYIFMSSQVQLPDTFQEAFEEVNKTSSVNGEDPQSHDL